MHRRRSFIKALSFFKPVFAMLSICVILYILPIMGEVDAEQEKLYRERFDDT